MKKIVIIVLIALFPTLMFAQSEKDKMRFAYVTTHLKLAKDTKAKLQPVFYAYMREYHAAKDIYNNLKTKYETAIKKNTLTADQAKALNTAHWQSDAKVLDVRRNYTQKFYNILSPQQVYALFMYSNDSKTKMQGK